jgi:hypothetical protein
MRRYGHKLYENCGTPDKMIEAMKAISLLCKKRGKATPSKHRPMLNCPSA